MRWWFLKKKRDYDKLEKRVYVLEEGLDSLATQLGYRMTRGFTLGKTLKLLKLQRRKMIELSCISRQLHTIGTMLGL